MSGERLTTGEVAILLAIMAEAGEVSNTDLKARYGFALDGGRRRKLNELKLVESRQEKRGYPFVHTLTDGGWERCYGELYAPCPMGKNNGGGTTTGGLYAVLRGIGIYLDRAQVTLADVFQPAATSPDPGSGEESMSMSTSVPATPPTPAELEARIRDAYTQLATRPGDDWVSLADLRPLLRDAAKADVDAALERMARSRQVRLMPEENQKLLRSGDRAAAVRVGNRDHHFLSIEVA